MKITDYLELPLLLLFIGRMFGYPAFAQLLLPRKNSTGINTIPALPIYYSVYCFWKVMLRSGKADPDAFLLLNVLPD